MLHQLLESAKSGPSRYEEAAFVELSDSVVFYGVTVSHW